MKRFLGILIVLLSNLAYAAGDPGLVTRSSSYSVAETIDRFESVAKAEKALIFARVDFQALAAANNGNVRPSQLLLFGRGGILPPLLPAHPLIAVDLPLKVLAWEDGDGKVWLSYNASDYLKNRHAVAGKDDLFKRLDAFIQGLAGKALEP